LDRRGISYCCKSSNDDNGITNLWRYRRNLGTFFSAGKSLIDFKELLTVNANLIMYFAFIFVVVLYTSWPQTMIAQLENLTWKSFKPAITSNLLGL
jgi:hypothetical protein